MLVNHLIVDASTLVKGAPLQNIATNIYSIPEVLRQIPDLELRDRLRKGEDNFQLREPTVKSLNIVKEVSVKAGLYAEFSLSDLKFLALAHDFYVEFVGKDSINYNVKNEVDIVNDTPTTRKEEDEKIPFGFVKPTTINEKENDDMGSVSEEEDDESGWVDEGNLVSVLGENGSAERVDQNLTVAVITSNFALQTVIMHMKMKLMSVDGLVMKRLDSSILRCRACRKTIVDLNKKFCFKCGNDSLDKIDATVDENGTMTLRVDWEKVNSTRGLNVSRKQIKGGKHDDCHQFFEDQRMPHNRPAKCSNAFSVDNPFAMHDVTSRASQLGIRANRRPNCRSRR